jgi:hypothetical protein
VIGHQDVSMNGAAVIFSSLAKRTQIELTVSGREKYCVTIHAARKNMLGYSGNEVSWLARHSKHSNQRHRYTPPEKPWIYARLAVCP